MQLVTWKGCESHVTDQSSSEAAHSLEWFTAQQFVPRWARILAVYLLYMKHSRLEICICQTSPITPAACHTWGSSQPARKKRRSGAVSSEPSADWKGTSFPHFSGSNFLLYFSGSLAECWVNDRGCVKQVAEAASFFSAKHYHTDLFPAMVNQIHNNYCRAVSQYVFGKVAVIEERSITATTYCN